MSLTNKPYRFLVGLMFWATVITNAVANDSSVGDINGTIQFLQQPDISMEKETLFLSPDRVKVAYVFKNTGKKDQTILMAFPMPAMYFGDSDHNAMSGFNLWVNQKLQPTQRRFVVLLDGKDITQQMKSLGWDEKLLTNTLNENRGWFEEKTNFPADWLDKYKEPRFTLHEYFVWKQPFLAGKEVSISHQYRPSVSTGVPYRYQDLHKIYKNSACIDTVTAKAMQRAEKESGLNWQVYEYILTTANNWKGPIGDFNLILKKQSPKQILSTCFHGPLVKKDAVTFEFHQKNYRPEKNIKIALFN